MTKPKTKKVSFWKTKKLGNRGVKVTFYVKPKRSIKRTPTGKSTNRIK